MHAWCVAQLALALFHDVGLCVAFDRATKPVERSRCLVAMSRHGGPLVISFLTRKHRELAAAQRPNGDKKRRDESTVELLTALRRAQGKPDPLPVIANVPAELESIFPNLPVVDAAIENRDFRKSPITIQVGGDYRSGRQDRWRFEVRNAQGKLMPVTQHQGLIEGGGLFGMGVLKYEKSWETVLPMKKFVDLPPGDYTVVVQYHDQETISDLQETTGLLVCRSEPFKLHVQPRVIDVTKKDRQAAKEAVAALADQGPVKILDGSYDKHAHEFIKPDSVAGKLLALGWRAVPVLLDALEDEQASDQQKAWMFAVLHSITSWHDPRHERGVLAEYQSSGGGWVVSGGRGGRVSVMGLGSGGGGSMSGGKFDPASQKAFAKEWKPFRDYIVVRDKP